MANRNELQGSGRNKGVSRVVKMNKRAEAEERNSRTPLERTKAFRLQGAKVDAKPIPEKQLVQQRAGRKLRSRKANAALDTQIETTESFLDDPIWDRPVTMED